MRFIGQSDVNGVTLNITDTQTLSQFLSRVVLPALIVTEPNNGHSTIRLRTRCKFVRPEESEAVAELSAFLIHGTAHALIIGVADWCTGPVYPFSLL
jgi:hypothetical protein